MIRLLGTGITALAVCLLGFWYSRNRKKRIHNLYQMLIALQMLKGEIGFTGRILEEAFADIGERMNGVFGSFFGRLSLRLEQREEGKLDRLWKLEEIVFTGSGLTREDLDLFGRLGRELGFLDTVMQLRILELLEMQVKSRIEHLEKGCEADCRMYQSLGMLGALTVLLVML